MKPHRLLVPAGIALCAVGLLLSGYGAWRIASDARIAATIAALDAGRPATVPRHATPAILAAQARGLLRAGRFDDAQAIIDRLVAHPALQATMLTTLGNARLRHALEIYDGAPYRVVRPLIALARSDYHAALHIDADDWSARGNFAIATGLLAEREQYQHSSGAQMSHDRAIWPDIPGVPNGMP